MNAIVVIAGSSGSLSPLRLLIATMPIPCNAAIFVVIHIGANKNLLPSILERGGLPAAFAQDGALIEAGHVYVAPSDRHMLVGRVAISLSHEPKVNFTRPAADPLFVSVAEAHGELVMGIVLSGGGCDGAAGLRAIKAHGGTALVQHPGEAKAPSMPIAALMADHPDACLPIQEIAQRARSFCSRSPRLSSEFRQYF
jgi:two-component system, chemotaxis family, protein-glutamate methylesterase/glutaminase